jgi:hypothetical protein
MRTAASGKQGLWRIRCWRRREGVLRVEGSTDLLVDKH